MITIGFRLSARGAYGWISGMAMQSAIMTEFERAVYADMKPADRVSIWLIKAADFFEYSRIMTEEDTEVLRKVLEKMKEGKS